MKFFPLLWANLLRKKIRLVLTIGSFAVALFLFGLLGAIETAFNQGVEVAGVDRLIVRNKTSLILPLPYAYKERLLQIEGVKNVSFATWFGGVYQNERNWFPQFAIEKETWLDMYPEFQVPHDEWNAFLKDKEGCIMGRATAKLYDLKVGDRIPLIAPLWTGTWEFNVCGIYDGTRKEDDTTQFWLRWDYLEDRRPFSKGTIGWYIVRIHNPDDAPKIVEAIDERFSNSAFETKTETERAFMMGFAKQMGNIQLLILVIGSVVFFTLLLITGNTLAMSVRERTSEWAILKTLGYTDLRVLGFVITESLIYACTGGILGLVLAKIFTLGSDPTGGFLPVFYLSPYKMFLGLLSTIIAGILSGLIPAVTAMRLKIVDALRRI